MLTAREKARLLEQLAELGSFLDWQFRHMREARKEAAARIEAMRRVITEDMS
jgi:hypothetical protein